MKNKDLQIDLSLASGLVLKTVQKKHGLKVDARSGRRHGEGLRRNEVTRPSINCL